MPTIFTIGHSNRSTGAFLDLLRAHGIRGLVDIRRFPGSRRHPHFARRALAATLAATGSAYAHEPDLGGHRRPRRDSPNTAWRRAGFRAYADHMGSAAFRAALDRLLDRASARPTTVMCAEADARRCHRRLTADALVARDADVVHILGRDDTRRHTLDPQARILADGRLVYPAPADEQIGLFE